MARRDNSTMDLPGVPRRVGRPPSGQAKTGAQRQRDYAARQTSIKVESVDEFLSSMTEKHPVLESLTASQVLALRQIDPARLCSYLLNRSWLNDLDEVKG